MVELQRKPTDAALEILRRSGVRDEVLVSVQEELERLEVNRTLVTVPQAAELRGISRHTIWTYIRRDHLHTHGERKVAAPGGKQPLVCLEELDALLANPPKPGRPFKVA